MKVGDRKPNKGDYKTRLLVDTVTAPIIRYIFLLYCSGEGLGTIARILNDKGKLRLSGKPWTKPLVRGVLLDPTYRGQIIYHRNKPEGGEYSRDTWTVRHQAHEPLCTESQASYIDARLGRVERKIITRRSDRFILNGGLMRCRKCNGHMIGWTRGTGNRPVYICSGYKNRTTDCGLYFPVDTESLEAELIEKVSKLISTDQLEAPILELLSTCDKNIHDLRASIKEVARQIANLVDAITRLGMDSDLEERLTRIQAQKRYLEAELQTKSRAVKEPNELLAEYRRMHDGLIGRDRALQRSILKKLILSPMMVNPEDRTIEAKVGVGVVGTPVISDECTQKSTRYGIRRDQRYLRHRPIIQGITRC